MANHTARLDVAGRLGQAAGTIEGADGAWRFSFDPRQVPAISSSRKAVWRGTYTDALHATTMAARALAYDPREAKAFGVECANLGLLASLTVGPRLLAICTHRFGPHGPARPTIIEEDVGENLAELLSGRCGTGDGRAILHAPGTRERDLEDMKILFDVYVQISNAHEAGIYHRDLRCENVCVRRFGERPQDIRATLIDFELGSGLGRGEPHARSPLYRTLFQELPTHLAGTECVLSPNPLELDMAYLAALGYHVVTGTLALNGVGHDADTLDGFSSYLRQHVSYFGYSGVAAPPYARRLERTLDIDWLADELGLARVDERTFPSAQLLAHARTFHRPYLDGRDMAECMAGPEARLAEMVDRICAAKFETYKELRRAQGREVVYERMEDQPEDLRRSNRAQAEHIPVKVRALGYLLVDAGDRGGYDEVRSLTDEQVETLARLEHERWMRERLAAGWTLDRTATAGDPTRRTSPYLVPYDELTDDIREYDRDAARQLIPLVRSAGLVVVRPR